MQILKSKPIKYNPDSYRRVNCLIISIMKSKLNSQDITIYIYMNIHF